MIGNTSLTEAPPQCVGSTLEVDQSQGKLKTLAILSQGMPSSRLGNYMCHESWVFTPLPMFGLKAQGGGHNEISKKIRTGPHDIIMGVLTEGFPSPRSQLNDKVNALEQPEAPATDGRSAGGTLWWMDLAMKSHRILQRDPAKSLILGFFIG